MRRRLDHVVAARGPGHRARGWWSTDADGRRARHPGERAGAVRRPAPGRTAASARLLGRRRCPVLEVSPRRWGRRMLGEEKVALTSAVGRLPLGAGAAARRASCRCCRRRRRSTRAAEAPQPLGLVGAHRSRRVGRRHGVRRDPAVPRRRPAAPDQLAGLAAHRRAARGDHPRPRRTPASCSSSTRWPTTGGSGGVDGAASSLDVTVRAAAALAEHHVRTRRPGRAAGGRRAAASSVGVRRRQPAPAAASSAGWPRSGPASRATSRPSGCSSGRPPGTVVIVLSPMLSEAIGTATATPACAAGCRCSSSTPCPPDAGAGRRRGHRPAGRRPGLADAPARARAGARRLAALGCPVVAWRGPGTLDDVLRRLARRAQLPRVRVR